MTTNSDEPSAQPVTVLWRVVSWLCLLTVVPTLLAFGARWFWILELFAHFRPHCLLVLTVAGLVLTALKRWAFLSVVVAAWGWNLFLIAPCFIPVQTSGSAERLRVLSVNVLTRNRQYDRCRKMISASDADLVLCLEVNDDWGRELRLLGEDYPHQHFIERDDNFGIAVLSRFPWSQLDLVSLDSPVPSVQFVARHAGCDFTFIGTHPPPPGRSSSAVRNRQLRNLAQLVSTLEVPVIVAGDLNITPWSPHFSDLAKTSGLSDARNGFGIQPTWPSRLGSLGIPIDYVLVSKEIQVLRCEATASFGSDHRGVLVELRLPN